MMERLLEGQLLRPDWAAILLSIAVVLIGSFAD